MWRGAYPSRSSHFTNRSVSTLLDTVASELCGTFTRGVGLDSRGEPKYETTLDGCVANEGGNA